MNATPYPFESWPRVRREDVARLRRVARALPSVPLTAMCETLEGLLGASVSVQLGALYACDPGALAEALHEPLVAIVLESPEPGVRLAVEVSPDFALAIVDRLLGGDGLQVGEAIGGLTELECGVVAYAGARVVACTERPWKVAGVVTTRLALLGVIGDEGSSTWSAEVKATDEARVLQGVVRVWVPDRASTVEVSAATDWLDAVPMTLVADGGETTIAASELVGLGIGDVLLVDDVWSRRGEVRLRLLGARATTWWARSNDDALTVSSIDHGRAGGATRGRKEAMSDEHDATETLTALGDAPVEVSVELARVRLTLAELRALRVGEIVASGTPIGEHVRLRVGDVVIGEGELVEIEGEVGVRVKALG